MLKIIIILLLLAFNCQSVNVYSSFWAPLFDNRILQYRVDATFDPEAGKLARDAYMKSYGYRGKNLIADLGNGKGFGDSERENKVYGDVKFYYIYPGADRSQAYS